MRQRLAELERAETVQRQAVSHPQLATEPPHDPLEAALAPFPDTAKEWLRAHREILSDPRANAALQHFHYVAKEESGEEYSPAYFERLEHHLGLRSAAAPEPDVSNETIAQPAPRRQSGGPVSAPVSRESPSWSSGRPASESRVNLTGQELELAHTLGLSPQEYLEGKKRMLREKQAGLHDHGR
jgi:hypothetical protein